MKKLYYPKTGFLLKKIYFNLVWDFYNKTNAVFLTFDDGPVPGVTDKVLDILNSFNAKATFFCLGKNVAENQPLFQRIIEEGHEVGNHSYSHLKGWFSQNKAYFDDIDRARKYINSNLFRPPHGKIGLTQINHIKKNYKIIMWDIMSFDFDPHTTISECVNNVVKNVREGSIITFHDSVKASEKVVSALPIVIKELSDRGFVLNQKISDQFKK